MVRTALPDINNLDSFEFIAILTRLAAKRASLLGSSRPLTNEEIKQLQSQGNETRDWSALRVGSSFSPTFIRNNRFFGACVLGACSGTPVDTGAALSLPSGIYDSIIIDSIIGDGCCIWNVKGCSNYFIDSNVVLHNVGTLACSKDALFGNGREMVIGIETGGREILSFADMTIATAQAVATQRDNFETYRQFIAAYCDRVRLGYGIIEAGSRISNCPQIIDTFIGAGATCSTTTLIRNATVLSSPDEPTRLDDGVYVRNSIIQWGCHASSMAIVDDSVMCEHSHAERHGKLTHSIIGPNTGIAEGEVTASLVGPFVGFHHQSLLIGALWPEGKGNVAYGANVGSNHTAKAPDQEIYCGEGLFFGLGVNIKFPADFSRAPYSIIATGVTTLPQRVEFPFSLISEPVRRIDGVPPAYNELLPGWVLSDNLYAIARNEGKFVKRNRARRSSFTFEVLRPDIVDLMVAARGKLLAAPVKEYYTDADIPGTGKNFITRQGLEKGVATYSRHIERYCLAGLFLQCQKRLAANELVGDDVVSSTISGDARWEHERLLLVSEGFARRPLVYNLKRYAELSAEAATAIASAKQKDDVRGRAIMADYDTVHTPAAGDAFVKETVAKNISLQDEIRTIIDTLKRIN